jgi:hypothetical protein
MKLPVAIKYALLIFTLQNISHAAVRVRAAQEYTFGGYAGEFPSPPHADGNPKRAVIIEWTDRPYRLIFSHEASYCPWIEFPSGAAVSFQFWEGNDGWAELFNDHGRKEKNSFVDIRENTPQRVRIHWTYFGVNIQTGERAYLASEDFHALDNGLVLRRQTYKSWMPNDHRGYAREPIELIGLAPVGKTWRDVLPETGHALSVIDAFSDARYDIFWSPDGKHRREGCEWETLDKDALGVAMILPLREAMIYTAFGDKSGFHRAPTKLKEHTFKDTGGIGWGSQSWDHWPIGWINSQGHEVDAESAKKYPSHFSPAGMDFFALPNEQVERGEYWSLIGVGQNTEEIREQVRRWLEQDPAAVREPDNIATLPAIGPKSP